VVVGLGHAFRTAAPICDFGFVDLVAHVVRRRQAGSRAHRAVDVDHTAADPTDQMVVVVPDPGFEASRRTGWLNTPDDPFNDQDAEGVVHRLERDRTDLRPDGLGYAIRGDMRLTRDRPQHSQPLGRNLKAVSTKELRGVSHHPRQNRSTFGVTPRYFFIR
jgi:hypothetical protein